MSKNGKKKDEDTLKKIAFITSITNLLAAIINMITNLKE